jgi:MoaA/NifB/PqqE/SkfB family radical SAM enzyme
MEGPVAHDKLQRRFQPLRTLKIAAGIARAAIDRDRPLITHLVITRRCNLSCGYCFEYDKVSPPVPTDVLRARIDKLAELGSVFVTLTGGESLLHPDVVELVRHIRARGMTPFLNTNGYRLTAAIIDGLNDAGLYGMQLSIDNVEPDDVSKKSLRLLMPKLRLLARRARFHVRINTVLGAGPPDEAVAVARAVVALGFSANCSLVRHEWGAMKEPDPRTRAAYDEIRGLGRRLPAFLDDDYTRTLLDHGTIAWKCRAGARTFLVSEDGRVHLCQPRSGEPGIPLADYSVDDIRRAFDAPKPCAATCPISYAHHASRLDRFRSQRGVPLLDPGGPNESGPLHLRAAATARRSPALVVLR